MHRSTLLTWNIRPIHDGSLVLAVLLLALMGVAGCGGSDSSTTSSTTAAAPSAATGADEPGETRPEPDPVPTGDGPLPVAPAPEAPAPSAAPASIADIGDPKAGRVHYANYCTSCHGAAGAGDGPIAAGLNPKPAAHTDGAYMNALSNDHLFKVLKEGGPAVGKSPLMAAWGGTLSDDEIWDVVAYVRTLAKPAYQP